MPTFDFDGLEEGAAFTAASVNTPFTDARAAVNALETSAFADGGLHAYNLPSITAESATTALAPTAAHSYTNVYPGYDTDTFPPSAGTGWQVVNSGGTNLRASLPGSRSLSGADNIRAILVLANVEVFKVAADESQNHQAAIALMYLDGSGTWRILPRTERFVGNANGDTGDVNDENKIWRDVAIRTLIRSSDLTEHGGSIRGVQVVVSCNDSIVAWTSPSVSLWRGRITMIPLIGEAV
jgi:hypothetical protein